MGGFLDSVYAQELAGFHCPRYAELPGIELYMDQVISVLEEHLRVFRLSDSEKTITPTMVNNYVKQRVIEPPHNKKYNRSQLAHLFVICMLKQILSISEIAELLTIQTSSVPTLQAYDYFCDELEDILRRTFSPSPDDLPLPPLGQHPNSVYVRALVIAFVNKVYISKALQYERDKTGIPDKKHKK